ncbi:RNA polymerase sigma factor, sigma-70 family [Paraoerskovia marina]|uniref:RNA polymerase sigma factor, sigma-70 family n=1 Tax=Paraoerskovia marina TaxID=545619 RepID=A0A1H1MY16_9CELL|nr:sigma-70 family RNA polymerase sigma factor [Paraoerskovia marina]SDR91644.1 RNA polymerase sigma factor, sigma-70 family [Paraoerskovia marina]
MSELTDHGWEALTARWWVEHASSVRRSVMTRVGGRYTDDATSRAMEKMIARLRSGVEIISPRSYWTRAAINEAVSMSRADVRMDLREHGDLPEQPPNPVVAAREGFDPQQELDRTANIEIMREAIGSLRDQDRDLLLARHVEDRSIEEIATADDVARHTVTVRLGRAEDALADAFAAAHAANADDETCRAVRKKIRRYVRGTLTPSTAARVEKHLDECASCSLAYLDIRDAVRSLRASGPLVFALFVAGGAGLGAPGGADLVSASDGAGARARRAPHRAGIVGSVAAVAALAVGALAISPDQDQPTAGSVPVEEVERAGQQAPTVEPSTTAVEPVETPPAVVEPVETPLTVVEPVETPPTGVESVETPPTVVEPVETPPTVVEPVETPPTVVEPVETPAPAVDPPVEPEPAVPLPEPEPEPVEPAPEPVEPLPVDPEPGVPDAIVATESISTDDLRTKLYVYADDGWEIAGAAASVDASLIALGRTSFYVAIPPDSGDVVLEITFRRPEGGGPDPSYRIARIE